MSDEQALLELLASRDLGVLATLKRDGRPQLSNVVYAYDPRRRLIRISVTAARAKTRNLTRDPRASLHTMSADGWSWVVAEGTTELTPVAGSPDDEAMNELIDLYRSLRGEHPDWDEYRAAMIADRRLVVRLPVERVYGQAG
ncbi:PPOX class F420-dependent oxidoreductase [Streptomyces durbertensis]|uniref:PPOX class F420-dependent oxidoreductase n=1 Tax=Streptomyces durbertensis TaxID=2448886 RepID=A0ABR6EF35_9ACTN|nr:TIGR03618 family F420-dependent PPOX class oxidoreductase [Streptomyces durbertensis]MBB1243950.1 PPOX class F420-dependent oxidoreductase [Streptomyces durbertensis]